MPYVSHREAVLEHLRREAGARAARQRDAHYEATAANTPVLTGALLSTLEKFSEGPTAAGVTQGGERAPYAVFVNDGHVTRSGSFVSGRHFWEAGEAAGRSAR